MIAPQNASSAPAPPAPRYTPAAASTVKKRHRNLFQDQIPRFLPQILPRSVLSHHTATYVTSLLSSSNKSKKKKTKTKALADGSSEHRQPLQTSRLHDLLCTRHTRPTGRHHPGSFGFQPKLASGQREGDRQRAGCSFPTLLATYQASKKNFRGFGVVIHIKPPQDPS